MKKFALSLIAAGITLASSAAMSAGSRDVAVYGDRFGLNVINNFYDNLTGADSNIIGSLTAGNLAGVELLWAVQPAAAYSAGDITVMKNFMNSGGRIAFMGEHGAFAPQENARIAAAVTALGGNININVDFPDAGFHDATVGNGQILVDPLTVGVNTYNYACFASLVLGGNAKALMTGINHSLIMMAYQAVGAGSIFLITDQNVWDNVSAASNDNKVMFENLLSATVTGTTPEPETYALMLLGLAGVGYAARRKAAKAEA